MDKEIYPILAVGNIYFPIKDKDKKFKIISTDDVRLDTEISKDLLKLNEFDDSFFIFQTIKELWSEIEKEPKYSTYDWIVPGFMKIVDNVIHFTIDCLEEVKQEKNK